MAGTLITDLVDPQALVQLKELDDKITALRNNYTQIAKEMVNGIRVNVEVSGDLEKMNQVISSQMQRATQTTTQLNQAVQETNRVVANTTNTISRQLMEQEKLNKAQRDAATLNREALDIADKILGTREQNNIRLAKLTKNIEENKKAQDNLKKSYQMGQVTEEAYANRMGAMLAMQRELMTAKKDLNRILENEQKMMNASEGSYGQLSLQLERMKMAYKQMNDEQKNGEGGRALEAEIQNLDAHLKDLGADMGEFQRNVGNYAIANKSIKTELKELTGQMAQMLVDGVSPTSEQFLKLAERAGMLRDAMSDAKSTIKDYANDTKALTNINSVLQTGMSAWQAYEGAMSAFGIESKGAKETMQKMMGIMSMMNGLQKISTELTTNGTGAYRAYHAILKMLGIEKTVETATTVTNTAAETANTVAIGANTEAEVANAVSSKAVTVATEAQTAATVAATSATSALRVAMATVGIGALIALIGTLIHVYGELTKETNKALEKQKEISKEMDNTSRTYGENRAQLQKLCDGWKELKSEQEKNEFIKENQSAFDSLGVSVENVDDAQKLLVTDTEAFIKSMKLRAQAVAYGSLAAQEYAKAVKAMETGEEVELSTPEKIGKFFDVLTKGTMYNVGQERKYRERERDRRNAAGDDYARKQYELEKEADGLMSSAGIKKKGNSSKSKGKKAGSKKNTGKSLAEIREKLQEENEKMIAEADAMQNEWSARMAKAGADLFKDIANGDIDAYNKQVELVKDAYAQIAETIDTESKEAIKAETKKYDDQIDKAKKAGLKTEELEAAKNKALSALASEYGEQKIANEKELNEVLKKMQEDFVQREQEEWAAIQTIRDEAYREEIQRLSEEEQGALAFARSTGKSVTEVEEKYAKKRAELDFKYKQETFEHQIDGLQAMLSKENLTDEQRLKLEEELTKAKMGMQDLVTNHLLQNLKREEQADAESKQKRIEQVQQWADKAADYLSAITDLASAIFDGQIQQIEKEQEANTESYDKQMEQIDNLASQGAITEEEAEIRKREAKAATEAKEEELAKKKAKIQYKQALVEKANSIAQIGISTALGIMRALAMMPPQPGLAAAIGAMGAIQVATAIAQPIKAYAEGTKGHPHGGGIALVGDGGRAEVVRAGGQFYLTPDTPTLMDLPRGAEVFPSVEAFNKSMGEMAMLNSRGAFGPSVVVNNDYSVLNKTMNRSIDENTRMLTNISNQIRKNAYLAKYESYKKSRL